MIELPSFFGNGRLRVMKSVERGYDSMLSHLFPYWEITLGINTLEFSHQLHACLGILYERRRTTFSDFDERSNPLSHDRIVDHSGL